MEDFRSYFKKIDEKTSEIPENNLLFGVVGFVKVYFKGVKIIFKFF